MLVPRFRLDQSENDVSVRVHTPYSRIEETEVYVNEEEFVFCSGVYHLRLCLPGRIVENENSHGKYDADTHMYHFKFDKVNKGEHFENLDTITNLLVVMKERPTSGYPKIEVVNVSDETDFVEDTDVPPETGFNSKYFYGFGNKLDADFAFENFPSVFDLKNPIEVSLKERIVSMKAHEDEKFSSDHYLADYFESEFIQPSIDFKPARDQYSCCDDNQFTNEEIDILKNLPNKEYLLNKIELNGIIYGLVDILFAYCYEKRSTCGESSVESCWTINKLSGTFSWFVTYPSVEETLVSCYRRSLIYPLYRNFELSKKVQKDVETIFHIGRKHVIKCLLDIHELFESSEDSRYILNQFYIKDYLIFVQRTKKEIIDNIYKQISSVSIAKSCLNLDLEEYEEAGEMARKEYCEAEADYEEITSKVSSMNLSNIIEKQLESDDDSSDTIDSDDD